MANKPKNILVLGSDGLIGKALTKKLKRKNYLVEGFDIASDKYNQDLSAAYDSDSIKKFSNLVEDCHFIFFLAFDVGGAVYLEKHEHDYQFISNNISIMKNVFEVAKKFNKPLIFTSTMMTKIPASTYGLLKSVGERYAQSTDNLSVRFWNIYGPQDLHKDKNHVITDFIMSSLKDNKIKMKTDGEESRQFLHVDDAVDSLILLMNNFSETKGFLNSENLLAVDVSSGSWIKIKNLAEIIAKNFGNHCFIEKSEKKDRVQKDAKIEPNLFIIYHHLKWLPKIQLADGLQSLIEYYKNYYDTTSNR